MHAKPTRFMLYTQNIPLCPCNSLIFSFLCLTIASLHDSDGIARCIVVIGIGSISHFLNGVKTFTITK
jgi:hypothetical protein